MKYSMRDYIEQSYNICLENIENYDFLTRQLVEIYNNNNPKNIWLIASGSSYNACFCALPFIKHCIDTNVKVITPFNFSYYTPKYEENDLILVITQSGFSTNIIEVLKKLKQNGNTTICLTGNVESDIKNFSDIILDYSVGEELVGYVTKGVTTLCLFLMLFAINVSKKIYLLDEIKLAIEVFKEIKDKSYDFIKAHFKEFSSMLCCYCCGTLNSYGVTLEAALKIGETIHIPSFAYEVEEYIHGPNLQLTPNYTVLFFDGNDVASERVYQIYQATKQITEHTFIISSNVKLKNDKKALYISKKIMPECSSLIELPLIQLISYTINECLNSSKQHPLLKEFKKIVSAKTDNFVNYDEDD